MTAGNDDTVASSLPSAPGGEGAIPELVAERYQIVRWLGGGGMGRVYEALDTELGESIALKVLRAGLADDAVERFRREVRLTRRIQHRNIARMFDIGDHRGEKFLTMELVAGEPLSHVASHAGRLEWERLRQFAVQICEGLAAAHLAGVIHRDLKPDNVLIERGTERVVITDFGIARAGTDTSVTLVGAIVGTPRYMAPEQLAGSELDARADLFALGVIAHELLTNRPLFTTSDDIETLQRVRSMQIDPPSRKNPMVPPEIDDIVMTALERDPERRWHHATALRTALTTLTRRLGLQVTNQEVVRWLDGLDFDSATLPDGGAGSDGESVIISVEHNLAAPVTMHLKGSAVPPPTQAPSGTPAHTITAQRSIQPSLPPKELATNDGEYVAAVRRYERHEGLIPSESFLADEVVPTQVRTSSPRIQPPPLDADPVRASLPTMVEIPASAVAEAAALRMSAQQAAVAAPTPPPIQPGDSHKRLGLVLFVVLLAGGITTGIYLLS